MKIYILEILLICSLINTCFEFDIGIRGQLAWSAEKFLTGEFQNNLGSHCNLVAKDGKITGEYFTKPPRGNLIQPGFSITWIYTLVKDGALAKMIMAYKMEGEKSNGLENFSQTTKN